MCGWSLGGGTPSVHRGFTTVPTTFSPAGRSRPWPVSAALGSLACQRPHSLQPAGPSRAASLPGKGAQLKLEELLVPRKMAISPLESWLTARYFLSKLDIGAPATVTPGQFYECPPSPVEEGIKPVDKGVWDTPQMQCKNVLKIRRRKMNHHKYRKLVKRTRFLRRKVREGRLKRKQVSGPSVPEWTKWLGVCGLAKSRLMSLFPSSQIKFERDLKRIWLKAGLKEAPSGWQTPKIYVKDK